MLAGLERGSTEEQTPDAEYPVARVVNRSSFSSPVLTCESHTDSAHIIAHTSAPLDNPPAPTSYHVTEHVTHSRATIGQEEQTKRTRIIADVKTPPCGKNIPMLSQMPINRLRRRHVESPICLRRPGDGGKVGTVAEVIVPGRAQNELLVSRFIRPSTGATLSLGRYGVFANRSRANRPRKTLSARAEVHDDLPRSRYANVASEIHGNVSRKLYNVVPLGDDTGALRDDAHRCAGAPRRQEIQREDTGRDGTHWHDSRYGNEDRHTGMDTTDILDSICSPELGDSHDKASDNQSTKRSRHFYQFNGEFEHDMSAEDTHDEVESNWHRSYTHFASAVPDPHESDKSTRNVYDASLPLVDTVSEPFIANNFNHISDSPSEISISSPNEYEDDADDKQQTFARNFVTNLVEDLRDQVTLDDTAIPDVDVKQQKFARNFVSSLVEGIRYRVTLDDTAIPDELSLVPATTSINDHSVEFRTRPGDQTNNASEQSSTHVYCPGNVAVESGVDRNGRFVPSDSETNAQIIYEAARVAHRDSSGQKETHDPLTQQYQVDVKTRSSSRVIILNDIETDAQIVYICPPTGVNEGTAEADSTVRVPSVSPDASNNNSGKNSLPTDSWTDVVSFRKTVRRVSVPGKPVLLASPTDSREVMTTKTTMKAPSSFSLYASNDEATSGIRIDRGQTTDSSVQCTIIGTDGGVKAICVSPNGDQQFSVQTMCTNTDETLLYAEPSQWRGERIKERPGTSTRQKPSAYEESPKSRLPKVASIATETIGKIRIIGTREESSPAPFRDAALDKAGDGTGTTRKRSSIDKETYVRIRRHSSTGPHPRQRGGETGDNRSADAHSSISAKSAPAFYVEKKRDRRHHRHSRIDAEPRTHSLAPMARHDESEFVEEYERRYTQAPHQHRHSGSRHHKSNVRLRDEKNRDNMSKRSWITRQYAAPLYADPNNEDINGKDSKGKDAKGKYSKGKDAKGKYSKGKVVNGEVAKSRQSLEQPGMSPAPREGRFKRFLRKAQFWKEPEIEEEPDEPEEEEDEEEEDEEEEDEEEEPPTFMGHQLEFYRGGRPEIDTSQPDEDKQIKRRRKSNENMTFVHLAILVGVIWLLFVFRGAIFDVILVFLMPRRASRKRAI